MEPKEITGKDLIEAMNNGSVFFDVREEYEVAELAYDVDVKNIPLGQIQERINEFPKDKAIVVGCRSGARSMNAAKYLTMVGYTDVSSLEGGILQWEADGHPTK
ncbi:MAG: sulfurtransferase [Crocinitomicaceae bacterium]|nr:sulfurtransferase [Crocinitomicaceae bacterium]